MSDEGRKVGLDMEVIKFGVVIIVNLVMVIGAYFQLKSDVDKAFETAIKNEGRIVGVEKHNQKQDLETIQFRTEMKSRVANIEKLTEDIHSVIIGK